MRHSHKSAPYAGRASRAGPAAKPKTAFKKRATALAVGASLLALLFAGKAHAQTPAGGGSDYDTRFSAMKENLSDPQRAFDFVEAAVAAGDIRGAVAALERILQLNPELANIKFELGLLYLRLGQPDLAKSYIDAALASPNIPRDVRVRAEAARSEALGARKRHFVSGGLYAGVQYQSNPNASPDAVQIVLGGLPSQLTGDQIQNQAGEDYAGVLSLNGTYRYSFDNQHGDEFAVDGALYISRYAEIDTLSATALTLAAGPRFFRGPTLNPSTVVRPYATASYIMLDGDEYYSGGGAGITLDRRMGISTSAGFAVQYERREYQNSPSHQDVELESGDYYTANGGVRWRTSFNTDFTVGVGLERAIAETDIQSRTRYSGRFGIVRSFNGPELGFEAGYRRSDYDEPDPLISLTDTREEDRYSASLSLDVPIAPRMSVSLRADQLWNRSNLPNYDYDNTGFSIGLSRVF